MEKRKTVGKNVLWIILLISFIFIFPEKVCALSTGYKHLEERVDSLKEDKFTLSNLTFHRYPDTTPERFSLAGEIYNASDTEMTYTSIVNYFDKNYNSILTKFDTQSVPARKYGTFFQSSSAENLAAGYTIEDIVYYNLDIQIHQTTTTPNPTEEPNNKNYPYTIDKYDIELLVRENNTLEITENISAYFEENTNQHGIIRRIPLQNKITRLDGTTSHNRARISNISVNEEYNTFIKQGYQNIQIGKKDTIVEGTKNYTIKYHYNLGKDQEKKYDELYFNLIGDEWNTSIDNVTFKITMPKEFDKTKLGFSSGPSNSVDSSNITYQTEGNIIQGTLNKKLNPKEALTVRLELPEGYFATAKNDVDKLSLTVLLIPIILTTITLIVWLKRKKNEKIVETVEFYPPSNLNSTELAFLYKGYVEAKDVTSLLIYLANKGYIKIQDKSVELEQNKPNVSQESLEKATLKVQNLQSQLAKERRENPTSPKIKVLENLIEVYQNIDKPIDYQLSDVEQKKLKQRNKNNFVIQKLKDYDGTNNNEKYFLASLFPFERTEATPKTLYNNFYQAQQQIIQDIEKKANKEKIFSRNIRKFKSALVYLMIMIFILVSANVIYEYEGIVEFFKAIGITTLCFCLYIPQEKLQKNGMIQRIITTVIGLGIGVIPISLRIWPLLIESTTARFTYLVGILSIIVLIFLKNTMPTRTAYGNEMLGKIKGFKKFLETSEKAKLEELVMENPSYFYDILPFTYVLGISKKWIQKFETISVKAPEWYDTPLKFEMSDIGNFMDHDLDSINRAMSTKESTSSSSDSSSSTSDSSGGGVSGGGSGGGGGSSW